MHELVWAGVSTDRPTRWGLDVPLTLSVIITGYPVDHHGGILAPHSKFQTLLVHRFSFCTVPSTEIVINCVPKEAHAVALATYRNIGFILGRYVTKVSVSSSVPVKAVRFFERDNSLQIVTKILRT